VSRRCRSCDQRFRPDGGWQRVCWPCWRELQAQARRPRTIVVSPVDAELLEQAVTLCHHDRHPPGERDLCDRVTAALREALDAVCMTTREGGER
jgi:hypothetical protein